MEKCESGTGAFSDIYQNIPAFTLENSRLRAVILPSHGGKVASLYHKEKRFELLFQNPKPTYACARLGDDFARYEACGFDDAFPSVNAERVEIDGRWVDYPDHGELWSRAMDGRIIDDRIEVYGGSAILPYRFTKEITLNGSVLSLRYRIEHMGESAFPYVFLLHCLVAERENMQLEIPAGEKVPVYEGRNMGKWYLTQPVTEGRCGYVFPHEEMHAFFTYDPAQLPYLGYWYTNGGFRGDYNCALEPASTYYDGVSIAAHNQCESILHAGETLDIRVLLTLESTEKNGGYES